MAKKAWIINIIANALNGSELILMFICHISIIDFNSCVTIIIIAYHFDKHHDSSLLVARHLVCCLLGDICGSRCHLAICRMRGTEKLLWCLPIGLDHCEQSLPTQRFLDTVYIHTKVCLQIQFLPNMNILDFNSNAMILLVCACFSTSSPRKRHTMKV